MFCSSSAALMRSIMALKADRSCPDLAALSSRAQLKQRPTTAPDESGNAVRGRCLLHPKHNSVAAVTEDSPGSADGFGCFGGRISLTGSRFS